MQNNQGSNSFNTLKRSSDFVAIKQGGSVVKYANWLMISYRKNEMQQLRLGITIGRKVGGSVVRNKFKRWSKNIVRDYVKQRTTDEATHVTNNTAVGKTSGWSSKEGFDVNIVFKPVSNEFYKKLQFLHYKKALLLLFDKALK